MIAGTSVIIWIVSQQGIHFCFDDANYILYSLSMLKLLNLTFIAFVQPIGRSARKGKHCSVSLQIRH
jgi:hypothetical protein